MPRAEPSAPSAAAVASVFGSDTDHDETAGAPAAAAAAVPMMMRPQPRLSAGSGEVAAWLMSHGLDAYTAPLIEAGYTRHVLFGGMDDSEVDTVVSSNKMPHPHARAFKAAVQELRPRAAAAVVQPQAFIIDESLEAGLLAAPVVVHAVAVQPRPIGASGEAEQQRGAPEPEQRSEVAILPSAAPPVQYPDNRCIKSTVAAKRWLQVLLCGAAVQQAGWWYQIYHHGELGLWGGIVGGGVVIVGGVGFDCCAPGHLASWEGPRIGFWGLLVMYAGLAYGATFDSDSQQRTMFTSFALGWLLTILIVTCEEMGRMRPTILPFSS